MLSSREDTDIGLKIETEKQLPVDAQKGRGLLPVADIKTKEERGFVDAKTQGVSSLRLYRVADWAL